VPTNPIHYFAVVYDCASNEAAVRPLGTLEAALIAYLALRREHAELGRNDVEVLLVGADDLLTLEKLHGVSFTTTDDVTRAFDRPVAA
jgi:hypothetical protein